MYIELAIVDRVNVCRAVINHGRHHVVSCYGSARLATLENLVSATRNPTLAART